MSFFETSEKGYIIRIKLSPNASTNAFREVFCDENGIEYLKAMVVTVPEKGKANKELIKMLAKILKIAKSAFTIISGETDHLKKIYIAQPPTEEFTLQLNALKKEK
jgi:uncharacterized protein